MNFHKKGSMGNTEEVANAYKKQVLLVGDEGASFFFFLNIPLLKQLLSE